MAKSVNHIKSVNTLATSIQKLLIFFTFRHTLPKPVNSESFGTVDRDALSSFENGAKRAFLETSAIITIGIPSTVATIDYRQNQVTDSNIIDITVVQWTDSE